MSMRARGAAALILLGLGPLAACSAHTAPAEADGTVAPAEGQGSVVAGNRAPWTRTVGGTATADPDAVAAYRAKRAARSAGLDACHRWVAGYTPRVAAHDGATGVSVVLGDAPSIAAFWAGMAPKLAAEYAAIDTELAALPPILDAAAPVPELVDVLTRYRPLVLTYRAEAQAAQAAARAGDGMWGGTNAAYDALTEHMNRRIVTLCNRIEDE